MLHYMQHLPAFLLAIFLSPAFTSAQMDPAAIWPVYTLEALLLDFRVCVG
jgi:hypothetical protein